MALYSAASPGMVTAQLAVVVLTSELGVSGRLKVEGNGTLDCVHVTKITVSINFNLFVLEYLLLSGLRNHH